MTVAESSTTFDRTPDEVWSVIGDLTRFPEWFVMHEGFSSDPSAMEVGVKFGQRTRLLGMPAQLKWTIESVDPGRSYVMVGLGTMGVQVRAETTVAPANGATTVTIKLTFAGGIVTGPTSSAVEKEVTGKLDDSLAKLRAVLGG